MSRVYSSVLFLLLATFSEAATYYVKFDTGSDANPGTIVSPWKHCPGDNNATSIADSTILVAGDTVFFHSGAVYTGTITLPWSGTSTNAYITYDGKTWNGGYSTVTTAFSPGTSGFQTGTGSVRRFLKITGFRITRSVGGRTTTRSSQVRRSRSRPRWRFLVTGLESTSRARRKAI